MPQKPPTRKNPSVLEYLHNPDAYPHVTMNTQPELAALRRVGPQTEGGVTPVLPIPDNRPVRPEDMPMGIGGLIGALSQPGAQFRPAPRMSLVQAMAPPGAVDAPPAAPAPWGMAPSQPLTNAQGGVIGRFDSGIAPPDAAGPVLPQRRGTPSVDNADLQRAFSGLGPRIARRGCSASRTSRALLIDWLGFCSAIRVAVAGSGGLTDDAVLVAVNDVELVAVKIPVPGAFDATVKLAYGLAVR